MSIPGRCHILTVDDLSDGVVAHLMERARHHSSPENRAIGRPISSDSPLIGLIFLSASLRTRVGFAAAAHRLGWATIEIAERRASPTSMPETWQDTLRIVSGYVDAAVLRTIEPLVKSEVANVCGRPLLSAGDVGIHSEHPSQALIDMFTIEEELGPVSDLSVAICGDVRMRTVRSLTRLLARRPPKKLVLITDPSLEVEGRDSLPSGLQSMTEIREPWDVGDIDLLYVSGIPHGVLSVPKRERLQVGNNTLRAMRTEAIVLSPMPVIDEIDSCVRGDHRIRMFAQSDRGLYVRMALLEYMLSSAD